MEDSVNHFFFISIIELTVKHFKLLNEVNNLSLSRIIFPFQGNGFTRPSLKAISPRLTTLMTTTIIKLLSNDNSHI